MSRNLKRVPLDFAWPLDKVWEGYVNPHSDKAEDCAACDRSGYAPRAKLFYDQWYGCARFDAAEYGAESLKRDDQTIVEMARRHVGQAPDFYGSGEHAVSMEIERLWRLFSAQWCHNLIQADVDALIANDRLRGFENPTAARVNSAYLRGIGHDSINAMTCVRARCEREGAPVMCPECGGRGYTMSPEDRAAMDAWEETKPPTGEGYQLWEDVSEGSPQSPVFATLDELCSWCATNATTFADHTATAAEWKKMLAEGRVHHREGNIIFT